MTPHVFTRTQKLVVAILAFLQFTIILDFMVLAPLGALLMPALSIGPKQFGLVVSAYAFAAGLSGLLTAGFADRYDRKKILLLFYSGFVLGTYFCAISQTYAALLAARVVTGLFGGVIGSIVLAITADLFSIDQRGRVMGLIQTSFAASQILGLPIALYLSNHLGWHAPFYLIAGVSAALGLVIFKVLPSINAHILNASGRPNPFRHLAKTLTNLRHVQGFATVALLGTGGFMLMPFASTFAVNNLHVPYQTLPMIYLITGLCTMVTGPLVGRLADRYSKYRVFCAGSFTSIVVVLVYSSLSMPGAEPISLGLYASIMALLFAAISSRMISAQALLSALPDAHNRGAYMSISASVQQLSGGLASIVAGAIVVENLDKSLGHFEILGFVVAATSLVTVVQLYFVNTYITGKHLADRAESK